MPYMVQIMSKTLFTVSVLSSKEFCEIISELICTLDFLPSIYTEPDKNIGYVSVYFESKSKAEKAKILIDKILKNADSIIPTNEYEISLSEIKEEDWTTPWKKFFHAKRIGKNIIIKPPWENFSNANKKNDDIIIEMDPEMSFGTGTHGTTQACLEFLEKLSTKKSNKTFLDIGTGSGILSIAAAKLGFSKIDAFDNSQVSLIAIEKNIPLNPPSKGDFQLKNAKINYFIADLSKYNSQKKYDVVVANIISSILLKNVKTICSTVKPGGTLILSGILTEQFKKVSETFSNYGFKEKETKIIDGWKTGVFIK